MLDKIKINTSIREDDIIQKENGEEIKLKLVTQKQLYEEIIFKIYYRDHHSQSKWVLKLDNPIIWEDVQKTVHNFLTNNCTKTTIWEQIHLNFYTQYNYNKWHRKYMSSL